MKLAVATVALVVAAVRPAEACGVPDFGATLVAVAEAFASKTEPRAHPRRRDRRRHVHRGQPYSVAAGYAWGEKETGWLFPGSTVTRVLVGVRTDA